MKRKFFLIFIVGQSLIFSQRAPLRQEWVNETMQHMTLREKIGQLFILRAYGKNDSTAVARIKDQISRNGIGGLCFFQGDAETQANLTNDYQSLSKIPLFISMDAEWSLGMRLKKEGFSFPRQMCLGAIRDNDLIFKMGEDIGRHLKRLGVNFNFAPVVDINSNPHNPVINERSFGADRVNVTAKSFAYAKGLQSQQIIACAKHFPGHGDTDIDSHFDLPQVTHSRHRLDSLELFPFRILCEKELPSIMVAHLRIPSIDTANGISSSQSYKAITNILRGEYQYRGLIVTDALEMKAVAQRYQPGELELLSFKAGNDILLLSENVDLAIDKIYNAIQLGEISLDQLNQSVARILGAKFDAGVYQKSSVDLKNLRRDINSRTSLALKDKLYRSAITLARDKHKDIPIRNLEQKIVSISVGCDSINGFQHQMSSYTKMKHFNYLQKNTAFLLDNSDIRSADLLLLSIHGLNYRFEQNYGLKQDEIDFIQALCSRQKTAICIFGTPYVAKFFPASAAVICSYEDNDMVQGIAAQLVFGSDPIAGILPVDIDTQSPCGSGIQRPSLLRLGYTVPESEGLSSDSLELIRSIAEQIVSTNAAPGCQILIARNNKILYNESFGTLAYDSSAMASLSTLYDIASLTKITASAPALMNFVDQDLLNVNDSISVYLPQFLGTNKQSMKIRDALLHQARLLSWIPFYKNTLIAPDTFNMLREDLYRSSQSDSFDIHVTDKLFLQHGYRDTIYQAILNSRLHDSTRYLYSDLFFYFIPELVEKFTGQNFSDYADHEIFGPLGMYNTCFQPLAHEVLLENIAPTEEDSYFRHQKILACVHDMGSAMCGGVSGHAGVFSTAEDLAKLMQCYLNNGQYGGREYFTSSMVRSFTMRDKKLGRRALIFDMPELQPSETAYVSRFASKRTFGHTGFTGTCAWVDPESNLIFIFLSNRTYPDGSKNLLHRQRYRVRIQDIVYKSIL